MNQSIKSQILDLTIKGAMLYVAAMFLMALGASAQETRTVLVTETYTSSVPAQTMDKIDAVRALIKNKDAIVYKCQLVELTDKVTLKKRKSQ